MKITWLGHGSWRHDIGGLSLLIDPWLAGNPVLPEDKHDEAVAGATHILLTHGHFDHYDDVLPLAQRLGVPVLGQFDLMSYWGEAHDIEAIGFNKGGTVDLGGVKVTMVNAVHSSTITGPDGPRAVGSEAGYVVRGDGHSVYFSGDTDVMADMEIIAERWQPDIGVLSAGGHFTMDMEGAAYAAKKYFNFKTLIPGHYRSFPMLADDEAPLRAALPGIDVRRPEVLEPMEF